MSIVEHRAIDKGCSLAELSVRLERLVEISAREGRAFHDFESEVQEIVYQMGHLAVGMMIAQQGDGDLGDSFSKDTLERMNQRVGGQAE